MECAEIKTNVSYRLSTGTKFTVIEINNSVICGYIEGGELIRQYPCNMLESVWDYEWDIVEQNIKLSGDQIFKNA